MGYYLFSYGINTEAIKAVFGSKDDKALATIEATDTFDNYKGFLPDGLQTSPAKALRDIVYGEPFDATSNFAYGYAVICMCAALGSKLPYTQEIKLGYETDFINKYLNESFGIEDMAIDEVVLADGTNPFAIPKIEEWPLIGVLSRADLLVLMEKLNRIQITDEEIETLEESGQEEDEEKGFSYQHIKGFIENVDYCITNHLDLVTFCH